MSIEIRFTADALITTLERMRNSADHSVRDVAEGMAKTGIRGIQLQLSQSAHPRRTRTPSAPGTPPSLITGQLRRSVRRTYSSPAGAHQWAARVAPTTVYARIQEFGGNAGRGHRAHLPPRPYIRPAMRIWMDKYRDVAVQVFRSKVY